MLPKPSEWLPSSFLSSYGFLPKMILPGYIHKIHFTEHQFVNKGDTLLVVDDREYQIRLKEAEASLQDAIASSQVIDASINTSKSNIIVFDSNIEETETRLRKLKTDYTRYRD